MYSRGKALAAMCSTSTPIEDNKDESSNECQVELDTTKNTTVESTRVSSPAPSLHQDIQNVLAECITDDFNLLLSNNEESCGSADDYTPSIDGNGSDTSSSEEVRRKHKSGKHIKVKSPEANVQNRVTVKQETTQKRTRGRRKVEEGNASRKRKRCPSKWEKNIRKTQKAQGKEYTSVRGKIRPAKRVKLPCSCRKRCFEKLSEEERQQIFQSFYNLPTEGQNQYIASCILEGVKQVQRLRNNKTGESRRKYTRKYYLPANSGKIDVCQVMFLNTLDLTLKKVRVIAEKRRCSSSGICPRDGRGMHGNQPKISEADKDIIRQHINKFPAYHSHYSRSHTVKKYLAPDLNISKMYKLYVEYCNEKNCVPRNEAVYRRIFVEDFNLSFHKPQNDTCGTCDRIDMRLNTINDELQRVPIQEEKNKHLELADSMYSAKKDDKMKSSRADSNIVTLSFDLQKCLPTPFLKSSISFYKRKLWTLNLTIFETMKGKNSSTCYLWNETIANRGAQEIGSCLYLHLKNLPVQTTEINMYSDCCPGQNKNIIIAVVLLTILHEFSLNGRQVTINHKFLVPGHTHMEADTIHAAIEKTKKCTTANVHVPRDWANLIRLVPKNAPIKVVEVRQCHFLKFKQLLSGVYQHRKINTEGKAVSWSQIRWMQYRTNNLGKVFYKNSVCSDEEFNILDLTRKRLRNNVSMPQLVPISQTPLQLPALKIQNLKELIPYIDANSRPYYQTFLNTLSPSKETDEYYPDEEFQDNDDEDLM